MFPVVSSSFAVHSTLLYSHSFRHWRRWPSCHHVSMIATVRKLTVCQFTTLHKNMECSQQRNPSSRHCLNAVIIIRCRPPKDTSALFPGKFFLLSASPPHLPSIYHLVYYLCNLSQSFTMSSSESTGAITLDSSSIIMIAIWCFIGVAFLFMGCCCSCCVSLSPSSFNLHKTNIHP